MHYCHCGCGTRITGYGYRCPRGQVWTRNAFQSQFGFLAEMEEIEAVEELMDGNVFGAVERMEAAQEYASGNFVGGAIDDTIADFSDGFDF